MVLTLIAPLALLCRDSLNRFDPTELMIEAVTPANYLRFFADPFYWDVLVTTIRVSVIVTAVCLAARPADGLAPGAHHQPLEVRTGGADGAAAVHRLHHAYRRLDDPVRPRRHAGPLTGLNLMYAEPAVIAGIIAINLPFTVLTLQSVFEGIDPRLEEAAASMGAAPSRAFWRVVFPLALPGITIAAVLCFILCMNAFATPVLLGGPRFHMMAPLLFWAFSSDNNWPFAAAIAFILMGTTLLLTGAANHMIPRRYRA